MATTKKTTVKKASAEKVTKTSKKKLSVSVGETQVIHTDDVQPTSSGNYNPELRTNSPLMVYRYQREDLLIYTLGKESAFYEHEVAGDERKCKSKIFPNLDADVYSCIFAGRNDMTRLTLADQDIWLNTKDFAFVVETDSAYENLIIQCYNKHDKSCTGITHYVSGTAWRRLERTLVIAELSGAIKYIKPAMTELKTVES